MVRQFGLSALKAVYLVSVPMLPISYLGLKVNAPGSDLLAVPPELQWSLLGRCLCGFLSDVTLYTAFTYTAYSRAFCLSKLDTLLFPLAAYIAQGENLKPADYVGLAGAVLGSLLIFKSV